MLVEAHVESVRMGRPVSVSRGSYAEHDIVVVTLTEGSRRGRGECCAIAHFGLSAAETVAEIMAVASRLDSNTTRADLLTLLPPGPARNGLDCALWDLEAARTGRSAWSLAGLQPPDRVATAMTLSLGSPADMAAQARSRAAFSTLKLKLGREDPVACVRAVREARPDARLTVDANEAWSSALLHDLLPAFAALEVAMVEQPVRAGEDGALEALKGHVPLCADESFHAAPDLARIASAYDWVNIKLDKCGGLTAALDIIEQAPRYGLQCMVGCMFATSLAIAPALIAASRCAIADLDAPLHFASDRKDGYQIETGEYLVSSSTLWGSGR